MTTTTNIIATTMTRIMFKMTSILPRKPAPQLCVLICGIALLQNVVLANSCQDTVHANFSASTKAQLERVHSWILWKAQLDDER